MHSLQRKCTCDELFAHPLGLNLQNQAEQLNSACQLKAAIVAQCLSAKSCYKSECGGRSSFRDTEIKVHSQRVIKKLTSTNALQGVHCAVCTGLGKYI